MSLFALRRRPKADLTDYADSITSMDILSLFGAHGLHAWREAGCPIVTPVDFWDVLGVADPSASCEASASSSQGAR